MPSGVYVRTEKNLQKLRDRVKNQVGEKNPSWRGDKITYSNMHKWVNKNKGRPSLCEHCGTTTAKRYEWASTTNKLFRDLNSYIRLCNRCHHVYDNQWERMKQTRIKDGSFKFYGNQYKLLNTK